MRRRRAYVGVGLGIAVVAAVAAARIAELLHASAASNAKVLCSARFVAGRSLEAARAESLRLEPPGSRIRVDERRGRVGVRVPPGIERTALFAGDQGCVALPPDAAGLAFEPRPVEAALPPADALPWPQGDLPPPGPAPRLDRPALERAVDAAFADPRDHTAAFLVLYRGHIVAERYAPGVDRRTQLESWSMGKSLVATLVGRLVQEGALALDAPAPVAEWQGAGDPRRRIKVAHLLRMSSGLRFSGASESLWPLLLWGIPDHIAIYTGMDDVFGFAIGSPAEHPPGRVGRYRNVDPLVLSALVHREAEARGVDPRLFPQRLLFDRIGIRRQVLETDRQGQFILTGYDYGTARNWARLGLLYLQEGRWQGERLLPAEFVRFVRTPAPAWEEPVYGGLFWINGTRRYPLPEDTYYMAGSGGQRTFVVPRHGLVVVRLGHVAGAETFEAGLSRALAGVVEAVAER